MPTIAPVDNLLGLLSLLSCPDISTLIEPPNADLHVTIPEIIVLTLPDQHSTLVELNEIFRIFPPPIAFRRTLLFGVSSNRMDCPFLDAQPKIPS